MATALTYHEDKNVRLEMFCLVWLNPNPNQGRDSEKKLRSIINQLKSFQDVDQCKEFIQKTSGKDRLILIVTGRLGREILPKIHPIRQVISIYIYCMDRKANEQWSSKYAKVKHVVTNLDELVSIIAKDHQIEKKIEEPLAINIFSIGGQSTSEVNGKFVFSQVLTDCLLRLKSNKQDQKELFQLLKQQYDGNRIELDHIHHFQTTYRPNEVLRWYTRECFFYKTLNSVLRTENIHWMFLYRSFIFDLQQQLQKYQCNEILQVYRAQIVSTDELENLKKSINQFISINSFFSTTLNYSKALEFFDLSKSTENTEKILFQIRADPNMGKTKPFASISRFSDYPDEQEVLFMIGSIFKLKKISFDQKNQFSIIEMTLSSDDDNQLKQVLMYMKQQTGHGETNLRILAKVLWEMGKLDLAQQYLKRLLEQISSDDPIRGDLYEDLAKISSISGDFDKSMEWHKKAIQFKQNKSNTSSSTESKTSTNSTSSKTSSTTSEYSPCTVDIPFSFSGNHWEYINASKTVLNDNYPHVCIRNGVVYTVTMMGANRIYLESGSHLQCISMNDIVAYLESGASISTTNVNDVIVYIGPSATFTSTNSGNVTCYLESRAKLTIYNAGNVKAYLKANSTIRIINSGRVTSYYESGAQRTYVHTYAKKEISCSSITFNSPTITLGH